MTTTSDFASIGFVYLPDDVNVDPDIGKTIRYDQFVQKLFKVMPDHTMVAHASMGIAGEAGELVDAMKRHIIYNHTHTPEGKTIRAAVLEELGDLRFYMQAVQMMYLITEQEVLQHNALKLMDRYKGLKYSDKAAAERADKKGNGNV